MQNLKISTYNLYQNTSPDPDVMALSFVESHDDIAYCKAAVDRKPHYSRKSYIIIKTVFQGEAELIAQRVWYAYKKGSFKVYDQSKQVEFSG